MHRNHIVVIGGYGHVGQKICTSLADKYPGKVFAAGRNKRKAEQFSSSTDGRVLALEIDVTKDVDWSLFEQVRLIIVCIDQLDTQFVQGCLERGIDYIDISASYSFLSSIERLNSHAIEKGATGVLSVGLAPGLTNLLSRWIKEQLYSIEELNIYIMLGMGDDHGKAAIEWTLHNAKTDFSQWIHGQQEQIASFSSGKKVFWGDEIGWRKAYRFNFADQHVLSRTLHIPKVSTRLSLDSKPVTESIAWLRRRGWLKYMPLSLGVTLLGNIKMGDPLYMVKVEGRGRTASGEGLQVETMIKGEYEANVTAAVTSYIADSLYQSSHPKGIYHIEQLFDWDSLYPYLKEEVCWILPKKRGHHDKSHIQ